MIKNANSEEINAFIVYARPETVINESSSKFLNGGWFIQTIGASSEKLKIQLICKWDVTQELMGYAKTKEILSVEFLDFEKKGFILGIPTYGIVRQEKTNPTYSIDFEMAVVPNV